MQTVMTMQLILLLLLVPALSAADDWRPLPGHEKKLSVYLKERAPIYETKGYSKPKGKFGVGHRITISRELQGIWNKNKWLHVATNRVPKAPFWIETKYLTSEDQLKKVTSGWPVRYLYASGPECMYYLNFTETGKVDIEICGEKAEGHVYRDGPIVKVPFMSKKYGQTLIGLSHLDDNDKLYAVFAAGAVGEYEKQGLFTDPKKPVLGPWGKCILDCPDQATQDLHYRLTLALRNGSLKQVKKYIPDRVQVNERVYEPNKMDRRNRTPLMVAAQRHQADIVNYLLEQGADIHTVDDDSMTAYYYATRNMYNTKNATMLRNKVKAVRTVKYLLEAGADVDSSRRGKATPLFHAATSGFLEMARLLIEYGADINARSKGGLLTPLVSAARWGHHDVARLLIDSGADLDAKTKKGKTAVYFAVARRDKKMFGLLYEAGAEMKLPK